ncbi:hypothetical protein SAY86_014308 [Trapa natans]|uniref:Exostosin GT47 domain-containing protein n=1 Tax=Trapa natans TaxID=22666 RepID=A0AAN7QQR3_TRANT|nr:hypothetical protein SAY86_014308 [Trapa natans]
MERPVGKYRRGFVLVSVATFVFWAALIYVFNRNVVVDDEFDIRSLAVIGKESAHPNTVEKSEEKVVQAEDAAGTDDVILQYTPQDADTTRAHGEVSKNESDPDDGTTTVAKEGIQQPPTTNNTAGRKDSHAELVDGTIKSTKEAAVQQPPRKKASEKDSNEEPVVDSTGIKDEVLQPPATRNVARGIDSDEEEEEEEKETVASIRNKDREVDGALRKDDPSEEEAAVVEDSTEIKELIQQPAATRNVTSRIDSDEETIASMWTKDQEAVQQPLGNNNNNNNKTKGSRSSNEEMAGGIDITDQEESQQPLRNNETDGVGGDAGGSGEELRPKTESAQGGGVPEEEEAEEEEEERRDSSISSCDGRYIFVQILPRRFHVDLLKKCKSLSAWTDMCETLSNAGLGPELPSNQRPLSKTGWFSTNQFSLEVIFYNRMKQYKCLTNDSSMASAIYIPYFAGLDVAQYLWHSTEYRDIGPRELVRWLRARPEWKRMYGRDHFLVAGRISWDFRRETFNDSDWGTNLLVLPEVKQMTSLVLESTLIPDATDFAIPYPTYFHPASDADVIHWQNRMRRLKRPFLFSFAGARRPNLPNSIRDEIIDQCRASTNSRTRNRCKLLECYSRGNTCYRPVNLIQLFQESTFCLQPQGDSYTRRSTFDSILTGCIPVFFHSGSAYDQYKWHLPRNRTKYSVFIPEGEVKKGKVNIERVLSSIPRRRVEEMQNEVIDLIPKIVYADPRSELETFEDAFDLSVRGVLERINMMRKRT